MKVKLYGTARCHKTQHYISFFNQLKIKFEFCDVEKNESFANELRNLYENNKLNFPTITIDTKKLRNPTDKELIKWINKLP